MKRLLLGALVLGAVAAAPAAAGAATVAMPAGPTAVREFGGTLVFSQFQGGAWHLAVRRPGAAAELLHVTPSPRPFQADIGPGRDGAPQLVYRRCTTVPGSCDLYTLRLDGGAERPIRNADDPRHDDTAPTLWRGRLAWTRDYGDQAIVYTKSLTAPRSRPSTRLPGVPTTRCGDFEGTCGPTAERRVQDLELHGDDLAEIVTYSCAGCSGIFQSEVRLVRLAARQSILVAFQVGGLGGQSFVGPSFADGRLSWTMACLGDPDGCGGTRHGAYRFGLADGRYTKAAPVAVRVDGFADTGATLVQTLGCDEISEPGDTGCVIDEAPAPAFAAVRAPLRR